MFCMSKWYLDCVTPGGDVAILNWAVLKWGAFVCPYGATILKMAGQAPIDRCEVKRFAPPHFSNGRLVWAAPALDVRGSLTPRCHSVHETLLETPHGSLEWDCSVPCAEAILHIDGRHLSGLGYAERLSMGVKPWALPLSRLRWGRFLSDSAYVVWIDWAGQLPRRWVYRDGVREEDASVLEHGRLVTGDGWALTIGAGETVRSGHLESTALRPLRTLSAVLPHLNEVVEVKWLAPATLETGDNGAVSGWVVHEVVQWP